MSGRPGKPARIAYLVMVYGFLYLPIVVLVIYSFNDTRYSSNWQGFTFKWYDALRHNRQLLDSLVNSLAVALLSSTVATAIGTLAAVAFQRYRFPGRRLLYGLLFVVMMSPDIVMGISLLMLFILVRLEPGFLTLVLSHITFCLPFVAVTIYARIADFDPNVIEAAKDLGASEYQAFRHVILPMLLPAVVSGWLLSFTLSLDDVIVSFFVTGPTFEILPLKIYSMVRLGVKPEVNALSTLLFAITLVTVFVSHLLVKEKRS